MKLPKEIIEKYTIEDLVDILHIHSPSYVNIDKDSKFAITKDEFCYSIKNSKVIVSLFIKNKILHVTVYP
ncbi:hypothetical protein LCGC14_2608910 [marine sediment metagenome]|uniref:Uncharacterized protein n=1 Tax=marine sediment metagenome TaxID=412755 RepID=A0A0F9CZ79_9ZZZZ